MANNAINFFKIEVFDKQGFIDSTLEPWKPLQIKQSRKTLVKTGRLRQSITVLKRSENNVIVGTEVPYAVYHNEGTKELPKRQFIGKSEKLRNINKKEVDLYVTKFF
jgi:phage gpG-like protein